MIDRAKKTVQLVVNLAANDYRQKYAASLLGVAWGFIPSLMTVLIYWFIFDIGFRIGGTTEPYLIWIISGLIPWFFFSEALVGIGACFTEYSYLVKKVVFNIELLPLIKLCSSFVNHVIFMVILMYTLLAYGYLPALSYFQIFYYIGALLIFALALGRIVAVLNVLFRDTINIVMVILQFGVWLLPILWRPETFPESVFHILRFNPLYYVVQGYRGALVYHIPFGTNWALGLYFWGVTFFLYWLSTVFLKRMKGQFSDLL